MNQAEKFESWCVLELMGHVRMAGRVTEEERFGVKMGRIDVPVRSDPACPACRGSGVVEASDVGEGDPRHVCRTCSLGFTTVYFGGQSVYRMTPTTEDVARAVAKGSQPEPVHRWELPRPSEAAEILDGRDRDDDDALF